MVSGFAFSCSSGKARQRILSSGKPKSGGGASGVKRDGDDAKRRHRAK
ncbi:hypothetical protein HMPREF0574_0902 [Mobiluncus curtisii subsp. curtisii ATCC 35241]|uniref:Uncharacterized protein n=1 Tax=Mobiluncus curtisii (strain ATCC 43063 / DSM 2711 / V125) TaxID=548479 RepID=D6ZKL5_MOBCV|nr:hypothetical protein HMPREF0573_10945 [Mobiluncus curtisii ATCC 43063]EFL93896.1 hypothetical protein HMPREF0574_0902 [Mobiluncus curtisii subsp. curtisii ATCC 35241]